jgi:protein-L-isoaspartate(D-aspartate) O-methyltransferase
VVPGVEVTGLDISRYAIENGHESVRSRLRFGAATELPWPDDAFDLVLSINTLHNLHNYQLDKALREIERVGKQRKYVVVDGYRTEREKVNLMYWQLTCVCFYTPEEWEWIFAQSGYTGDYACIYYE